jgi:hypothetical protein
MTKQDNRHETPGHSHRKAAPLAPFLESEKALGDYWHNQLLEALKTTAGRKEVCYV